MSMLTVAQNENLRIPFILGEAGALSKSGAIIFASLFLTIAGLFAVLFVDDGGMALIVTFAAVAGGYMALNIGANDVANNVGPAVGSGALTLWGAIGIAIVFESAGAMLAGGDVVSTISKGIVDASAISDSRIFIFAMVSALLAGAVWLNLATWIGAPVSTTHSIVGGVLGGAIAAAGIGVVDWGVMSKIAASWFISPILGGVIAAAFLALIDASVFSKRDMIAASRTWVPVLLGVMASAFSMYLIMKGFKKIWKPDFLIVCGLGLGAFALAASSLRPLITRASSRMENHRRGVNRLFTIPLIFSAALLSFAHGANDVANAIGPLSAIVSVASTEGVTAKVGIPYWVMMIGAGGIAIGLALFGAKLIRTVGKQLTTLDQTRAFCICLSAAITVICASALGLPVSSTHIAIGSIFGIGFYREFKCNSKTRSGNDFSNHIRRIFRIQPRLMVPQINRKPRKLVRRKELLTIAAAWFITVPSAALIAAILFTGITAIAGN